MAVAQVTPDRPLTQDDLCEDYGDRIYKFATLVAGSRQDADDLAQDAIERAIRGLAGFDRSGGTVDGWLWRIVVNAARDAGRVSRRQASLRERIAALTVRQSPQPGSMPPGVHDLDLVAAVRRLRPRQRALIALRFGADLDHHQIAQLMSTSRGAVAVGLQRALCALRADLIASSHEGGT